MYLIKKKKKNEIVRYKYIRYKYFYEKRGEKWRIIADSIDREKHTFRFTYIQILWASQKSEYHKHLYSNVYSLFFVNCPVWKCAAHHCVPNRGITIKPPFTSDTREREHLELKKKYIICIKKYFTIHILVNHVMYN